MSKNQKHHNEKALKLIFLSNQRLKDEIRGKNYIKIVIKRMREKIKSKNKLEAIKKNSNWRVDLKKKLS
jgi:hypothetical protein